MKIGLVQYNPVWEDKSANMEKLEQMISRYSDDIELLVFPEMTLTGFTMESEKFAESENDLSFNFFSELAVKKNVNVIAGIIERVENRIYNSAFIINKDGKLINKYRKLHPFTYSGESDNYNKGNKTVIEEIAGIKTGISICYDLRFPELYRYYGKSRVDLIIVIANWPDARIEHWRTLLKARAIENQCFVAGVNRVGSDPKLNYIGYSSVFDPMGIEIVTSHDKEEVITADISHQIVEDVRTKFPFLNDIHLI